MVRINLKNPIDHNAVNGMIQQILEIPQPGLLLIDFGNHNFESIEVLKYCKVQLNSIQSPLLKFRRIAFLTIPPYANDSPDSKQLKYFHSEEDAEEWMAAGTALK